MISIFLSYRRIDYDISAKYVESVLTNEFGYNSVTRDQSSFVGGMEWAQQIRSHVIQADIVVCVISESWLIKQQKDNDYVCDELNLARSLGKPVIPVVIDSVDLNMVTESIPQSIKWLMELQVIHVNPAINQSNFSLNNTIRSLTGKTNGDLEKSRLQLPFFIALYRTIKSLFYPLSIAGASFRPDVETLKISIVGLIMSIAVLIAIYIHFTPYQVELPDLINQIFAPFKLILELVVITFLASFLNRKKISPVSVVSFSTQFAATLFLCFSFYISIFSTVLSSVEKFSIEQFLNFDSAYIAVEYLVNLIPQIKTTTLVMLCIINVGTTAHIIYVLWSYLRALGAMYATGLKLAIYLFICTLIILGIINFSSDFVDSTGQDFSTVNQKLPREFTFRNGVDGLVNGEIKPLPIKIMAAGNIKKNGDFIEVLIKELTIDNRTKSQIRPVIYALLYQYKNGKTVTPDPIPASNPILIGSIEASKIKTIKNISMIIKLSPNFISGETTLNTYVKDEVTNFPQAIYDLDAGPTILRW